MKKRYARQLFLQYHGYKWPLGLLYLIRITMDECSDGLFDFD